MDKDAVRNILWGKVTSNLRGNSSQFSGVHKLIHLLQHSHRVAHGQKALKQAKNSDV